MRSTAKNYAKKGDEWIVGGTLNVVGAGKFQVDGEDVDLSGTGTVADGAVTTAKLQNGAVTLAKLGTDATNALNSKLTATQAEAQADSTATDAAGLKTDLNSLLAKLRAAGILEE